ncbi:MAG: glycosyltransferase family 39 protein [Anaerolineae bacterium]|nr:glycosyltransferase family 39 protein [Anaerolineae bacterium]
MLALLLLGVALRLPDIGSTPPGLYHDEAQHGLDAIAVLNGDLSFYFEANNGREPLFIYLVTAAVAVLGRTPMAIRLPACFAGILTLAATYDLARTLWDRKTGRWALAILAVTFWHIQLSRVGFRAVLLPLFTALAISQLAKGVRYGHRRHWIAAGALYGASWYTYMAARFTPIAIGCVLIYAVCCHQMRVRVVWRSILLTMVAALIILLPLGIYTLAHPDIVLARTGQVSIFSEEIHHGRFWATFGSHILKTVGMFTVQGDRIWRHNLAWRPVWDPALGLAFTIGLGVALATCRRDTGAALIVIWTVTMTLPTLLAEDAPHFLRGAGVLPTAALLPALGLRWLSAWVAGLKGRMLRARGGRALLSALPLLLWAIGLVGTVYGYFVQYQSAPLTYHWFEGGPVDLAGQINRLRGQGWDGSRMLTAETSLADVYIDPDLWAEWAAVPYLLPESAVSMLPIDMPVSTSHRSVFVTWPYRNLSTDILPYLPHPSYIQLLPGPAAQGDLDPEPFTIATLIQTEPRPPVPDPTAHFEQGIILRAALVRAESHGATVKLWWETEDPVTKDFTVFVHYQRDGDRIAQHDGPPGYGHLPTTYWQIGDLILDQHPLPDVTPDPDRDTLRIGLYDPATGQGLGVLNDDGTLRSDAVVIPVVLSEP